MTRSNGLPVSEAAGLLLLVLAIIVSGAAATASAGGAGCPQRESIKTLFPSAKAVGFSERGAITFQEARAPVWPGRCAGWWAEYRRVAPDKHVKAYVDVSVTLYRTPTQALFALREPAYTSTQILPNGARARFAWDGSGIASVMRNVFISAQSSFLPTDIKGIPDFRGGPDVAVAGMMKIHRGIHANVLRLR
jgi:hypothetical protein